ncbi:MAG: AAA family ATPase [Candidatus Eremiobacteraeota bacterium]|nr:AAA family ATPase [Candidatus Eremiobacteraeota bacterium]
MTMQLQDSPAGDAPRHSEFKIVVAGDVIAEWRLAQSEVRSRTKRYVQKMGAYSVAEIITRMLAGLPTVATRGVHPRVLTPTGWKMEDNVEAHDPYSASYVICSQHPKRRGSENQVVWRIKETLGIDRQAPESLPNLTTGDDGNAALVVVSQSIGDDEGGFMNFPCAWPASLKEPTCDNRWLIVERCRPRFDPDAVFWKTIFPDRGFRGRLVLVVTAEDLRQAGLRISRGLSWEQTLAELYENIKKLTSTTYGEIFEALQGSAYLVVSFGASGAAIFSKLGTELRARLIYDPQWVEGRWEAQYDGTMTGLTYCLTAGLALEIIRKSGNDPDLAVGVRAGVVAARRLLENGYVSIGADDLRDTELPEKLRFHSSMIASVLRSAVAEHEIVAIVEKAATDVRTLLYGPGEILDSKQSLISQINECLETHPGLHYDSDGLAFELGRIYEDWRKFEAYPSSYEKLLPKLRSAVSPDTWDLELRKRLIDRVMMFLSPDRDAIGEAKALREVAVGPDTSFCDWTMLDQLLPPGQIGEENADAILRECANLIYGSSAQFPFPTMRIGQLFVTNRKELENLTAVRQLIVNYVGSNLATPLSIAVFGPPGTGKSFSIKQLGSDLPGGRYTGVQVREFNLSQFNGPESIAIALQQVRDDALSGKLPLVFWDEFDTRYKNGFGWLRYFLAPMQDGKYQDGSAIYNVGRSIFVFAGATHATKSAFLRKAKGCDDDTADCDVHTTYTEDSVRDKVPDFVSRLKGFVDVPALDYGSETRNGKAYTKIDAATAFRRAKLLCTFLERSPGDLVEMVPERGRSLRPTLRRTLNVDQGVVDAFLRVRSFRFGTRSMEAIVNMSALAGKRRYDRSSLPPIDQLELHVDAREFISFAENGSPSRACAIGVASL